MGGWVGGWVVVVVDGSVCVCVCVHTSERKNVRTITARKSQEISSSRPQTLTGLFVGWLLNFPATL